VYAINALINDTQTDAMTLNQMLNKKNWKIGIMMRTCLQKKPIATDLQKFASTTQRSSNCSRVLAGILS